MELRRDQSFSSLISSLIGCHYGLLEELIPHGNSSLMWNLYFISLFIFIWKTGVENNTSVPRRLFFAAQQRIAITSSPNYYKKMQRFTRRKNQEEHGPDVM